MLSDDHEFEMEEKYREDFYLLKAHTYKRKKKNKKKKKKKEKIIIAEISVLSGGDNIREEETGNTLEENRK